MQKYICMRGHSFPNVAMGIDCERVPQDDNIPIPQVTELRLSQFFGRQGLR
ncbi:MAG: hypothetical protein ACK523_14855 [Pirellulaceae bacterium]